MDKGGRGVPRTHTGLNAASNTTRKNSIMKTTNIINVLRRSYLIDNRINVVQISL